MKRIHHVPSVGRFSEAAMELAFDEALLVSADAGHSGACLRFWELSSPAVVLGRSSKVDWETNRAFCDARGVGIYRRCSGGASIVAGPGCLMYSAVLSIESVPQIAKIDAAHEYVMSRVAAAARRQFPEVQREGICDLAWRGRKFSGNALRIARRHVLYHGTLLHAGDLALISQCLEFAPRQPEYRQGREHQDFVTNVAVDPAQFADDLAQQFGVVGESGVPEPVCQLAEELALKRYSCEDWRYRH